ncbi:MAG: hypothetical protein KQH63_13745 [Desulfobulbaceae bacterium]|nr:hypothetical protein [Desulfobulbaceae bacterium]
MQKITITLLWLFSLFLGCPTSGWAALDMTNFYDPMFVDGNTWVYQKNQTDQEVLNVLPGTEDFNGYTAKVVKASSTDQYYKRYYFKDDTGFYELGMKKYTDPGDGNYVLSSTLTFNPAKQIAAPVMDIGDILETSGTYTADGITNSYTATINIIGYETITVPHGTYTALKFTATMGFSTETFWAVDDLGIIASLDSDDDIQLTDFYNALIQADAGPDQKFYGSVTLDGGNSVSQNGTITNYAWDVIYRTDPTNPDLNTKLRGVTPTTNELPPGVYDVTLFVTDETGLSASDTMRLSVYPPIPGDADGDGDIDGLDVAAQTSDTTDLGSFVALFSSIGHTHPFIGSWYRYQSNFMGFAEIREEMRFTSETFEQHWLAKMDTGWVEIFMAEGELIPTSGPAFMTMTDIFFRPLITDPGIWFSEGDPVFKEILDGYWGVSTLVVTPSLEAGNMVARMDKNGDGDFDDEEETYTLMPVANDALAIGHGTFPQLEYAGLGFHNSPETAAIYVSFASFFMQDMLDHISSVTVELSGPAVSYQNIELTSFPERGEWGAASWTLPQPADGGIWWISRIETVMDDGSSSIFQTGSPYDPYELNIVTSSGYAASGFISQETPGQDYTPPAAASYYYIETFPNGSSAGVRTDPLIKVFLSPDTDHWIAINDDGGRDEYQAGLKMPFTSGETYYIAIEDAYGYGGAYSTLISTSGYVGSSTATVSLPDAYEEDDDSAEATPLVLDTVQDHSFSPGETDWFVFTAP